MSDDLVLTVANVDAVVRDLGTMIDRLRERAATALYQEAEIEMTEAKKRTPVDTGALRSSGFVEPPVASGDEISVRLGFGGPAAPYAIIVHEDLSALHPVGQAKFLESTILESAPYMAARVAKRLGLGS